MEKSGLNISDRDKKLLLVLVAAAIIVAAYMLGYQRFSEEADEYKKELRALQFRESELKEMQAGKDRYIADTEKYLSDYNAVLSHFGSDVTQPDIVGFLNNVERITGTWLRSVTFTGTSLIYTFGQIQSSNPDMAGERAYSSDLIGYNTTLTMSYEATYGQWKELIGFINSYYSKNVIENINMSYSNISDLVSGTMTIHLYNILGEGHAITEPEFNIDTGSDNIFYSEYVANTGEDTTGDYILSDYDYYVLLNPPTSTMNACIIGANNDPANSSVISATGNDVKEASLTFSGTGGTYQVQTILNGETREWEITAGNTLDLLIMSSSRLSVEDMAGIELSIVNNTDMSLNLKVFNDDTENARVNIVSVQGDIITH